MHKFATATILFASSVSFLTTPAVAAGKAFDIAGVKLGDTVAQAEVALQNRGFEVHVQKGAWTYESSIKRAQVGDSVYGDLSAVQSIWATKGPERVFVDFQPWAPGGIVTHAHYSAPVAGRSKDELAREVSSRYGPITGNPQRQMNVRICSPGDLTCRTGNIKLDYLSIDFADNLDINLTAGAATENLWRSQFNAAVARASGPVKKSF